MQEVDFSLPIGTQIGDFRIINILGVGGFGITYKAQDTKLHRTVALKEFLPTDLAARTNDSRTVMPRTNVSEDFQYGLTKFLDEARTLAGFNHPNIVSVLTFIEENGTAYLVMEYIEGEALDEHLKKIHFNGNMSEARIREIVEPILTGLAAVHKAGLLHRDIKPGNIYLKNTENGTEPMLIDFGAARQSVGEKSKSMSAIVSDGYAPTEQYNTRSRQGAWTDLYAIGAVMYHLVIGEKPEPSTHRLSELNEDEPDPIKPLSLVNYSNYSQALFDAITACLTLKAKARPQTVEQLQQLLSSSEKSQYSNKANVDESYTDTDATRKINRNSAEPSDSVDNKNKSNTSTNNTSKPDIEKAKVKGSFTKWLVIFFVILGLTGAGTYGYQQYDQHLKAEAEKLEQQRIAKIAAEEKAKAAEQARLAKIAAEKKALKAEQERLARVAAEEKTKATEQARLATIAAEEKVKKAEQARLAKIATEKARKAEQARLATIAAEEKVKKAEQARLAKIAAEKAEQERLGRVAAEKIAPYVGTMVAIPAGSFLMGTNDGYSNERPIHRVDVSAFNMSQTEVTFAQWDACVSARGCSYKPRDEGWGRGNRPVTNVSYIDITKQFIPWLKKVTGNTYRLPSEAEWEYAARAGSSTKYSWGNSVNCSQARYGRRNGGECSNSLDGSAPVKSFSANNFGLYDMHGNVWEWTQDCWNGDYQGAPSNGSAWARGDCTQRVLRSGAWGIGPSFMRSAIRSNSSQARRAIHIGFRLVQGR